MRCHFDYLYLKITTASLQTFATIPTCMLGGFLGEYLGRRMVCCFISPLFLAGFLCMALAPDIYLLFFGRILGGLAIGLGSSPAGVRSLFIMSCLKLL